MPKKLTRLQRFENAYIGSVSTIIVTVLIILFGFFLPLMSAHQMQLAREGKGRYVPEEQIIWNWEGNNDFKDVIYQDSNKDELGLTLPPFTYMEENNQGIKNSVYWYYHSLNEGSTYVNIIDGASDLVTTIEHNTFKDMESETVVDNYGIFTFVPNAKDDLFGYTHQTGTNSNFRTEKIRFYLDVDRKLIMDNDPTKLKIFADYDESHLTNLYLNAYFRTASTSYQIFDNELMEDGILNIFEFDLQDIISIASLPGSEGYFLIEFETEENNEFFTTGSELAFDIQIHGLVGKTNAIIVLSLWFIVESILIIIMGIVMFPQISIGKLSKLIGFSSD